MREHDRPRGVEIVPIWMVRSNLHHQMVIRRDCRRECEDVLGPVQVKDPIGFPDILLDKMPAKLVPSVGCVKPDPDRLREGRFGPQNPPVLQAHLQAVGCARFRTMVQGVSSEPDIGKGAHLVPVAPERCFRVFDILEIPEDVGSGLVVVTQSERLDFVRAQHAVNHRLFLVIRLPVQVLNARDCCPQDGNRGKKRRWVVSFHLNKVIG